MIRDCAAYGCCNEALHGRLCDEHLILEQVRRGRRPMMKVRVEELKPVEREPDYLDRAITRRQVSIGRELDMKIQTERILRREITRLLAEWDNEGGAA